MPFKFNFLSLHGLDVDKRAEKFSLASNLAQQCVNSKDFELWFLSTVFTQLGERQGMTNQELLAKLLEPVYCEYYVIKRPWIKRYSSVIGWTVLAKRFLFSIGWRQEAIVYTYADRYDDMSVSGLVDHLTHEVVAHGNGFTHLKNWSKQRDLSLPYQVGIFAQELVRKNNNIP